MVAGYEFRNRILSGCVQAAKAVAQARKEGRLPAPKTLSCVDCGAPAVEYDHRDYNKPLDVQPVCRRCNRLRGRAIPRRNQAAIVAAHVRTVSFACQIGRAHWWPDDFRNPFLQIPRRLRPLAVAAYLDHVAHKSGPKPYLGSAAV